ncbi:P-loop NTPase [Photobacterium sp. WH77]|uniref:AAA family ATPase n=1 Tax=unclassified Photobacterium TaxID=2628852 RepID=UPI001ED9FD37|nr:MULTISPECIES: P-loop NTPase [unclassified Photobacterium]MCG2837827.1 P-loop NTPase [Photobacterium sp. WH77]MCG2845444.1 P-loop NTPase [Photobacterium sp. WH80]
MRKQQQLVAFVLTDASRHSLNLIGEQLPDVVMTVREGDMQAACDYCLNQGAPDVLIVDAGDCGKLESDLSGLAQCCPPTMKLVVLGQRQDLNVYRRLMQLGVSDYHATPLDADALRLSLLAMVDRPATAPLRRGRVIAVVGSGGGVGTSTVAANLAWLLADEHHQHVALVDLNTYHSQHPILLGVDYEHIQHSIFTEAERLDDTLLSHAAHQVSERLHLFYSQDGVQDSPAQLSQEVISSVAMVAGHYSTVVVDVPDLRDPAWRALAAQADLCLILHDSSLSAMRLLNKWQFRQASTHQRRLLVANQCRTKTSRVPEAEMAQASGLQTLMTLPFDAAAVVKSEQSGQPVACVGGKLAKQLRKLTQTVISGGASIAVKRSAA